MFRSGVLNTIIFAVVAVSVQMILGFTLALLTSRVFHGRVVYRTIFVLPILIPGIVIGAMWKLMYNFDFGMINQVTGLFGILPRDFLGERFLALASVIVVDIWHWTPFCFLLLLAGRRISRRTCSRPPKSTEPAGGRRCRTSPYR